MFFYVSLCSFCVSSYLLFLFSLRFFVVNLQPSDLNASPLMPGRYGLTVFSPEKMPRPGLCVLFVVVFFIISFFINISLKKKGKKKLVIVKLKAHSVGGREIFCNSFELWLKDDPIVQFEFDIDEQDAPATVTLTLKANHVMVCVHNYFYSFSIHDCLLFIFPFLILLKSSILSHSGMHQHCSKPLLSLNKKLYFLSKSLRVTFIGRRKYCPHLSVAGKGTKDEIGEALFVFMFLASSYSQPNRCFIENQKFVFKIIFLLVSY